MSKRRVCVVVNSRANYGRIKSFMKEAKKSNKIELQLIVGASALLYRFGSAIDIIRRDGFEPDAIVHSILEGETPTTMAKSTGLGIVELATHFENLKPDIVLTVADRFETLATAVASSYMNITLAHTQGGEVTGSIDESVRHAITKLAHIHFPATERAAEYLEKMGEMKEKIYLTGCPAMDLIANKDMELPEDIFQHKGVGGSLDRQKPYMIVLQHPVTTEFGEGGKQITETLEAVNQFTSENEIQVVWLWPNVDAGSDDISKILRQYRETHKECKIHFYKNFSPEDYAKLLANCVMIVGNSSSGLREGAYLGIPCINIGSRQENRERSVNVLDASHERQDILQKMRRQAQVKRYEQSNMFGDGTAGAKMVRVLEETDLSIKKKLNYL